MEWQDLEVAVAAILAMREKRWGKWLTTIVGAVKRSELGVVGCDGRGGVEIRVGCFYGASIIKKVHRYIPIRRQCALCIL